jgi:hypothetical protein
VKRLCLTHLQRDIRRNKSAEIRMLIAESGLEVLIPEVGDVLEI